MSEMEYHTLISPGQLSDLIKTDTPVIVDCRFFLADPDLGEQQYLESHIVGAHYAHLNKDLSGEIRPGVTGRHPLPDVHTFAHLLGSWGISTQTQVIVYDQNIGGIAARLWWMLQSIGHSKVAVLDGGWHSWQKEGMPTDKSQPETRNEVYPVSGQWDSIIGAENLGDHLSDTGNTLVDSRDHIRFTGEEEPIDPVAGHIPGAINLPFKSNNDENGAWRSKESLKKRFEEIGDKEGRVVFYCGSGVTACHNILAWTHAGLDKPVLYPGSWSEWIADSERPVATGDLL